MGGRCSKRYPRGEGHGRNNMPEEDVRKRIDSQNDNPKFSVPTSVVENYGSNSVIVQVQNLLKTMFNKQNTK